MSEWPRDLWGAEQRGDPSLLLKERIGKEVVMRRTVYVLMMCTWVLGIMACGSDNGITKKQKADDGRVLVRNETGGLNPGESREVEITVNYTDPGGIKHETVIASGEVKGVTGDELIEGGERVVLVIESECSDGTYVQFKQTVRIRTSPVDGNIEIRIVAVRDGAQVVGTGFDIV